MGGDGVSFREMGLVMHYAPPHWTPGLRYVALLIADGIMDEYGTCTAPVEWLADRTGQSQEQVAAQIAQLVDEGVLANHSPHEPGHMMWTWLVVPT